MMLLRGSSHSPLDQRFSTDYVNTCVTHHLPTQMPNSSIQWTTTTTTTTTWFSFTTSHGGLQTQATKKHVRVFRTRMILHHATLVAYARAMCQGLDASITNRYRVTCQNILTSIFLPLFPCHQEENGFWGAALIGRIGDENACSDVIGHERARVSAKRRFGRETGKNATMFFFFFLNCFHLLYINSIIKQTKIQKGGTYT